MFIITQDTPNPATLKFLPGCLVMGDKAGIHFTKSNAPDIKNPLITGLLEHQAIEAVYLGADFISITKTSDTEWQHIKPAILEIITNFFITGQTLNIEQENSNTPYPVDAADQEIVDQIITLLETRVKPAVAQDGGDITFHGFNKGIVFLKMQGACAGCPSSTATLKGGIENMLRHYIPEVIEVRAVENS